MSTRHAGFATVVTIDGGLVNELLAAATASVRAPSFSLPDVVTVGSDEIGISGSISFLTPVLSFSANSQNLIGVSAGATGLLQLNVNGEDAIEVQISLSFSVNVGLFIDVSSAAIALGPGFSNATVSSVDIKVDFGPPLVPVFQDAITSGAALHSITAALRAIPQAWVTFTVPGATGTISVNLYGVDLMLPIARVVAVPMNPDALTVAADVSGYTSGSANALVNLITTGSTGPSTWVTQLPQGDQTFLAGTFQTHTSNGTNLAVTVNADFLSAVVNGPISDQIGNFNTGVNGLKLNSVSLSIGMVESDLTSSLPTLQYGCISVGGSGAYDKFADFEFNGSVTPMLIQNISNDTESTFWDFPIVTYSFGSAAADIIEFLSFGVFIFAPVIINSILNQFITKIISQLPSLGFQYSGSLPVPGFSDCSVNYTLNGIVAGWDPEIDCFLAASVTGPSGSGAPPPPSFSLTAPSRSFTDPAPIPVTLAISGGSLFNPILNLHISWLVVRNDTGATVLSQDTLLTESELTIDIDRWTGDLRYNKSWKVTCQVYHPADPITPLYTYFNETLNVAIALPTFTLAAPPFHKLTDPSPIPVTLSISDSAVYDPAAGLAPGLTIVWTAVRQDTHQTVLNQTAVLSASELKVEIDRWTGTLIYNNTWLVTCQVYHAADSEVPQTTYFSQSLLTGVTDVVDRHHPYVHWQHTAFFHEPTSTPPGLPLKDHHFWHRNRHSRIHRTDVLIRCKVLDFAVSALLVDKGLEISGRPVKPPLTPTLTYLDTLTTHGRLKDVGKWRNGVLCDYCFFGGPTRTIWKTPTPPTPNWV